MITIKVDDLVEVFLALASAYLIYLAHVVGVMGDMADGQLLVWSDHQATPFALCLPYIFQLLIIHQMPIRHGLKHLRIFPEGKAHQGHQAIGLLDISLGLGEDDYITLIADTLEIRQGDGVGHATIEQLPASYLNNL